MKKWLFLSGITLIACVSCAKYNKPIKAYHPNGYYCQQIVRELHGDIHRHNGGFKTSPITEARLMREYQKFGCKERAMQATYGNKLTKTKSSSSSSSSIRGM